MLEIFDNKGYCDECGEVYQGTNVDDFCPKCGTVLKNDWYQRDLEYLENSLKKLSKSICTDCNREFEDEYNFCPICAKKLKKETFKINSKNNTLIGSWNGEKVIILDKNIFLRNPHFITSEITFCFENKKFLDEKLKEHYLEIGEDNYEKLSYNETLNIARICGNRSVEGEVEGFIAGDYQFTRIREDLHLQWKIINQVDY